MEYAEDVVEGFYAQRCVLGRCWRDGMEVVNGVEELVITSISIFIIYIYTVIGCV